MVAWEGTPVLTTPRLVVRTFREADLPSYAAINADPEVVRYLGGAPLPRLESDEIAAWANECWETERLGLLAVERRTDGQFLGMCGAQHEDWYPDDVQLAWRLAPAHWGHGYATEAATAWLGYLLDTRELPRVLAVVDLPNTRSRAVAERLGMTLDHEADLVIEGDAVRVVVFVLTRDQWQPRQPS